MKDLRTPQERAFIERLDAICEEMGEELEREHFSRGKPLVIERDGVTMLKHPDGRVTSVDRE